MNNIELLLRRIADSANAAQAHYQIWFTLVGQDKALPDYYSTMNNFKYVDFFHASNAGHYKLMFLELGCLFDADSRSASFRNLKILLKEAGYSEVATKIENVLSGYGELVSNCLTIRSKLIAHKEIGADSEKVHQDNGVVPDEIGRLLNLVCNLINDVDAQLHGKRGVLLACTTSRYERATFGLLEVLRNGCVS